jgi:hypothetical protein
MKRGLLVIVAIAVFLVGAISGATAAEKDYPTCAPCCHCLVSSCSQFIEADSPDASCHCTPYFHHDTMVFDEQGAPTLECPLHEKRRVACFETPEEKENQPIYVVSVIDRSLAGGRLT